MAGPRLGSRRSGRRSPSLILALVAPVVLVGCGDNPAPDDETNPARAAQIPRVVAAGEALAGAHLSTLDPATLTEAEIEKVLGAGPRCQFRYTSAGKPVLALHSAPDGAADLGVVKLNGSLIALAAQPADGQIVLVAEPVRLTLGPERGSTPGDAEARRQEADLVFAVGDVLRVGYRGYYECVEGSVFGAARRSGS